eukprot:jgi/Mesvir1/25399/Mv01436-RA.2
MMGGRRVPLRPWLALFLFAATAHASLLRPEGPAARAHHDHTMTPDRLKQLYATVEFYANISTTAKPYLFVGDMVDGLPRGSKNLMSIFMLAHQLQLRIVEPFASTHQPSTFHAFKTDDDDIPLSQLYDPDVFGPCFPDMRMVPLDTAAQDLLSRGNTEGEGPGGGPHGRSIRVAAVSLMYLGEQRVRRRKVDVEGGGIDNVDAFGPAAERILAQTLEDAQRMHGLKVMLTARIAVNAAASSCALRSVEEGLVGGHCGNLLFEHKLKGVDAVLFVKWTGVQRELDRGRASVRFLRPGRAGHGAHAGSCCHSPGSRSMLDAQREANMARCLKFQHKYVMLAEGFVRDHLRRPFLGVQVRTAELFQWHHAAVAAKAAMSVQAPLLPSHAAAHAGEAVGACMRAAGGGTFQLANQGGEHSILLLSDAQYPGPEALAAGAGTNLAAAQAAAGITGQAPDLPAPATVAAWRRQYLTAATEAGHGHDVPVVPFTRLEGQSLLTTAVVEMLLQVQADRFVHFSSPLTSAAGPEPWVDAIRQLSGVKRGTVGIEMVPACDMAAVVGAPHATPGHMAGADATGHHPTSMAARHHHHHRFPHTASSAMHSHKVGVVGGGGNAAPTAAGASASPVHPCSCTCKHACFHTLSEGCRSVCAFQFFVVRFLTRVVRIASSIWRNVWLMDQRMLTASLKLWKLKLQSFLVSSSYWLLCSVRRMIDSDVPRNVPP